MAVIDQLGDDSAHRYAQDVGCVNRQLVEQSDSAVGEVKLETPLDGDGLGKLTGSHAASSQRAFSCIDAE